jgi:hypothetical protein
MKRILLASVLMAGTMFAQGKPDQAAAVDHDVKVLTAFFGLDATTQVPRVTQIVTNEQSCLANVQGDLARERAAINKAMKDYMPSNVSDATARFQKAEEAALNCRTEAVGGIYKQLTPDQRKKLGDGMGPLMGADNRFAPRQ